jgi:tRNA1Val (adenine37-N6)-methyltransferase
MSKAKNDTREFHFKPFSLFHHRSTMKTGTDAILLGIWASISHVNTVLDIGSGCGIISLLIASRVNANINSIELDSESVEESKSNFLNSPFKDRMEVIEDDFVKYMESTENRYDLIVSNPPFFTNDLQSLDKRRTQARHTTQLSFYSLCKGVSKLLNPDGRFCVVIPFTQYDEFCSNALRNNLFVNTEQLIFSRRGLQPNRINIEFRKTEAKEIVKDFFIIREENNKFTDLYRSRLEEFYLSIPEQ